LALSSPEAADQYAALTAIRNTAALLSRVNKTILLFFRLPAGARSLEGELTPGVDVLSTDYVELPSGSMTDGCCWANRYPIAAAPQWLLNELAALAASQTTEAEENT